MPTGSREKGEGVQGLLDAARQASDGEKTSVAQIVRSLGQNSLTPNLIFVALAVVSPLSGIPLFSSVCGISIALISLQMLVGRDQLWLPGFVMSRQVDTARLDKALTALGRPARWLDSVTRPRLSWLVQGPAGKLTQLLCMLCGMTMPLLEFIPFTSTFMGVVVTLMAFGLLTRDGLFTAIGMSVLMALGGGLVWFLR